MLLWDLKATKKGTRLVEVPWFGCICNEVQLLMQSTATYAWKQFIYRLEKKWKITWKFWGSITSYLLHQEFEVIVENNSLFSTCRSEGLQPLQKTASNGFNKDGCTVFILPYDINLNLSCDYHENYFSIKKWHKKFYVQYKPYLINNSKCFLSLFFFLSSFSLSKWLHRGFMDTFLDPFDLFRQRRANIAPSWGRQSWLGSGSYTCLKAV